MHEVTHAVQAVLFDYGLVLTGPPDPAAWERLKLVFNADERSFHAAYWKFRHDYDRGALSGDTYWQAIASELGESLNKHQLQELIAADTALWTQPNQPMIDWAAKLQRVGIKTGILSNIGDAMELGILAKCPWLADFAHHTFSHRLGIAKPEAAIYRHAAEGLGVKPEQILFIDDRDDNIAAARAAGMQALQFTDHISFVAAMTNHGFAWILDPMPNS